MANTRAQKGGGTRRQALGVAVLPETLNLLDRILKEFEGLGKNLPDWFQLPSTRSGVAAWVLEKRIEREANILRAIAYEYEKGMESVQKGVLPENDPDYTRVGGLCDIMTDVKDPFYGALRATLKARLAQMPPPPLSPFPEDEQGGSNE